MVFVKRRNHILYYKIDTKSGFLLIPIFIKK